MRMPGRTVTLAIFIASISPGFVSAQHMVSFNGTWTGVTTAADLSGFPVVGVIAEGGGSFSHLGSSTMVSPHTTNVITGETLGDQIFTAANGDQLTAYCAGFPLPQADGTVVGTLQCTVTGGTGRFEGATGAYTFALTATPQASGLGYATTAEIYGVISTVGSSRGRGNS
jgi:hypothetical protein